MEGERDHLLRVLQGVRVFSTLEEQALRSLVDKMERITYGPGEVLCREGEAGDRMFIIESGQVSVLKGGQGDVPVEVAVLEPGQVAGELSLFGETPRTATLQARGETSVCVLGYDTFQQLLDEHPDLARAVLSTLAQHLVRGTSVVARLLSADLDRRLKVAFFDSKPYTTEIFQERNPYNYAFQFYDSRLSLETASLATGHRVVCVFVNDELNAPVIDELQAMGVEMIALRCAGYNNVDLAACRRHRISVARVPAYSPHAVAEHAAALMMTLNRKIHRASNRVRESNFSLSGLVGFDMHGKTAGVIGTGRIGICLLEILAGFGCRLLAYSRTARPELEERLGVRFVGLEELLTESDVISLHTPLTPQTYHLIDAAAIARMKDGVMLINTGRGPLVDTVALLDGLKTGKIGYAGLDVYEEESGYFFEDYSDRVMTDDVLARLTTFNNVIVTSHQAFLTREALGNIADVTVQNIREFELGGRMEELTNYIPLRG